VSSTFRKGLRLRCDISRCVEFVSGINQQQLTFLPYSYKVYGSQDTVAQGLVHSA
jgi:hypothetical protein